MSYEQARSDIVGYLNTNYSTTAIDWENSKAGEPALPFIQPSILDGTALGLALDYQSIQYPGVISINVWLAQGSGTIVSNQLADELVTLFTHQQIGIVETKAAYKTVVGESNGRYQLNITIPYEWRI